MTRDTWLAPFNDPIFEDPFKNHRRLVPFSDPFFNDFRRVRFPFDNKLSLWDDTMFDIGKQIESMRREMEETMRRFGLPDFKLDRLGGFDGFERRNNQLMPYIEAHTDVDGRETGKYTMSVPIGGIISPEDLKISLKDNIMTVEAKKEQKSQDGSSRVYQEFVRKFTLPPSVDARDVKSVLSPEGVLKIEAPLPRKALPEPRSSAKEIPILKEY